MLAESPYGAPSVELALGAGVPVAAVRQLRAAAAAAFERGRLRQLTEGLRERLRAASSKTIGSVPVMNVE